MFDHWNLWFGIYLKFGACNSLFLSEPEALRAGGRFIRVRAYKLDLIKVN